MESCNNSLNKFSENNDNDKIINSILNKIGISKIINDIIDEMIEKIIIKNEIDKIINEIGYERRVFQSVEVRIVERIYNNFGVKELKNNVIDFIYTHVNYNESWYINLKSKELMTQKYLRERDIDKQSKNIFNKFLGEEKKSYNEIYLNVDIILKNLPFIRKLFIVTPTPHLLKEYYLYNEKVNIIPLQNLTGENDFYKLYFRPNNIITSIKKLPYVSDIFLFGNSDCIICNSLSKDDFFIDNKPTLNLQRKTLLEKNLQENTANIKFLEEYNTNILFEKKFNIFPKLVNSNRVIIVRKDVIDLTLKFFNLNESLVEIIDFLLLQSLTGVFFNLYDAKILNKNNCVGFYQCMQKNPYEKFNLIKNKTVDFFCVSFLNNKYLLYYLYAYFINVGIIENKIVSNLYFIIDKKCLDLLYEIPSIENRIRNIIKNNINIKIFYKESINESLKEESGNKLYIVTGKENWGDMDGIVLEVNSKFIGQVIPDILYFMNVDLNFGSEDLNGIMKFKEKNGDKILKIHYPRKFIKNLEVLSNIPYSRILNFSYFYENTNFIKIGSIQFKKNIPKN